jgi:hypothetical protein
MAPVDFEPDVACAPLQPPEAVHEVALVDDHVMVEEPPLATLLGLALSETLGADAATVTVADCEAVPPAPLHVSTYFVVAVNAAVLFEPLVASGPLQPPDAVQAVSWLEDQVNIAVAPLFTVVGLAVRVTAGAAVVTVTVAVCEALPPAPLQVRL